MTFRLLPRQSARLAALWLFLLAAASAADYSKISPDLKPLLANSSAKIDVIVQYNSPPQTCTSGGLLGGIICTTVNLLGGVLKVVFTLINAVSATQTYDALGRTQAVTNVLGTFNTYVNQTARVQSISYPTGKHVQLLSELW